MITKGSDQARNEINFTGIVRLFSVDGAQDQVRSHNMRFKLSKEYFLSLCAALEVGFQIGVFREIPENYKITLVEAFDYHFDDERPGLLANMFYSRLHGSGTILKLEKSIGFSD